MDRPRWVLEVAPTFTDPYRVAERLEDPILIRDTHRPDWEPPDVDGPVVVMATARGLARLRRAPDLSAAIFDDPADLRCSSYYRAVYPLLARTAFILPLTALGVANLRRAFGDVVFVRADRADQPFEAQVVAVDDVGALAARHPAEQDELVVVSDVVDINRAYRCFSRDGRVFAHSGYPAGRYGPAPPHVVAFAEEVAEALASTLGTNMHSVDVAECPDGLRLLKVGGVCSQRLYGCSVDAFIEQMESEAARRFEEI